MTPDAAIAAMAHHYAASQVSDGTLNDFLFRRWGVAPWHHRKLDLASYAMPIFGELLGLYKIAEKLGVEAPDHTAAQDVATLRACYRRLEGIYDAARADLEAIGERA